MKRSIIYVNLSLLVILISTGCMTVFANAKYYPDNIDNIYVHKRKSDNEIALTFDDGPHPQKTVEILKALKKHNVKATFFIIGQNAQKYPEILQMIAADGHEIANHTYDHKSLYKQSNESIVESVRKCSKLINSITGRKCVLFRPPEGFMNDNIAQLMKNEGYDVILWKIDTYDWKGRSATDIYNSVVESVKGGDIILMHDYIWRKSSTAQALNMIIESLKSRGFKFLTVSELIKG